MVQTCAPVTGARFFDRKPEINQLVQAIARLSAGTPQWIAILGPRKIGKTSLVLEAARQARATPVRVVALDVQEQEAASLEIFRRLALRVVDCALGGQIGKEPLEPHQHSPAACRRAVQGSEAFAKLPAQLRRELLEIPNGAADADRVREWLDLPERLAQPLGLRFVIAIDEFNRLEALARKQCGLFAQMRSLWQRHQRVGYFISGSGRSMLLELISRHSSPFFLHFSIMELGVLERAAAIKLLRQPSDGGAVISQEIAEKAVDLIGGHPWYLQLLRETLVQETRVVAEVDLADALQRLLFAPTGRLSVFFDHERQRLAGRCASLNATLNALANGPVTLTDLTTRMGTSTEAAAGYLECLKDAVTVTRADERYQLSDPTFALWLRQKRSGALTA